MISIYLFYNHFNNFPISSMLTINFIHSFIHIPAYLEIQEQQHIQTILQYMNTEQKISVLHKFILNIQHQQQAHSFPSASLHTYQPSDFDQSTLPQLDVVGTLIAHHNKINKVVNDTYRSVQDVVRELGELQNRKHNVNKLLDSMTAIKQAKRLSFGLGESPIQIYKNLQVYQIIRQKIFYCDKYVQKIQQQIVAIEKQYKENLEKQLTKPNSETVILIAKILTIISEINQHSEQKTQNLNERLSKFYKYLLANEIKKYENDLFNIPITGNTTASIYIFFDIAKDVMKSTVNVITSYRENIVKVGGLEALHVVIVTLFSFVMEGIILEILMREKKYFSVETIAINKIGGKEGVRFNDYFNQFSAIQNQIERLKIHLSEELNSQYPQFTKFTHELANCTNSAALIELSTSTIAYLKAYTRSQFDKLLKKSPFIVPLWQNDGQFLQKLYEEWKKQGKEWIESDDGHEYLTSSFSTLSKSLQKSLDTLNILIISQMISFMNNNLVQEDSFHAFNQIFDKAIGKFPTTDQKYHTVIILLINYLFLMPNALQVQIEALKMPVELESHHKRLNSELKQLVFACQHKCKEVIQSFITSIVDSDFMKNELIQDYKKVLEKWKGIIHEPYSIFIKTVSEHHGRIIFQQEFEAALKSKKHIFSAQHLLNLQKEVRSIMSYYQKFGHSVVKNFNRTLKFIQILLAESEESFEKLIESLKIETRQDKQKLRQLRTLKA